MNTHSIAKNLPLAILAITTSFRLNAASQDRFADDFSTRIDPAYWHVNTAPSRFSVAHTNEAVNISSVVGTSDVFLARGLASTLTAYGDFSVSVEFRDARLDWNTGWPGNQAQLNCFFGDFGTTNNFLLVRSDENVTRHNVHVWVGGFPAQGGFTLGPRIKTNANSGTLRVTRTGGLVRGFFNSTLIAETNSYRTDPAHFSVVLQNNWTRDAVSIVYDNFELVADRIEVGPKLAIEANPSGGLAISWPSWGVSWTTNYALESVSGGFGSGWNLITNLPSSHEGRLYVTPSAFPEQEFFRLRKR